MIYILHIDPPLAHARHYVGWTKDADVTRRVAEHLNQTGRRPSRLVGAALRAGRTVTLAATLEGDRELERKLKNRGGASNYCPACRKETNARKAAWARAKRAKGYEMRAVLAYRLPEPEPLPPEADDPMSYIDDEPSGGPI